MNNNGLTFFGALRALVFHCLGFYIGFWLMKNGDAGFFVIGYAFVIGAGFFSIGALLSLLKSSVQTSVQMQLINSSRTPSEIHGTEKLAKAGDSIIKTLSNEAKGLFLGAAFNCLLFIDLFRRGNAHWMIYAPARSGKSSCVIIPTGMSDTNSVYVQACIKPDIVDVPWQTWVEQGKKIIVWDPYGISGRKSLAFNLLSILVKDVQNNNGKNLQTFALLIANTLIQKSKAEENPFFREAGIRYIAAMLIFLAVFRPWKCNLPGLQELIWISKEERMLIALQMKMSDRLNGLVKRYGNHLEELFDPGYVKTFGPGRDYAINATLIYDPNTDLGKGLMGDDFTLDDVLKPNTVFLPIIPEAELDPNGKVIGLIHAMLFEHIAKLKKPLNTLVVLDEAGNFGTITNLPKAMTLYGAKGLRVVQAFQSRGQAIGLYGENDVKIMEDNCTGIQEWGINNLARAKEVSERIGDKTVKTFSMQFDPNNPRAGWRPTFSESAKKGRKPEDILSASRDKQYIILNSENVIEAELVPYYQVKELREKANQHPEHKDYPPEKSVKYSLRENTGVQF